MENTTGDHVTSRIGQTPRFLIVSVEFGNNQTYRKHAARGSGSRFCYFGTEAYRIRSVV